MFIVILKFFILIEIYLTYSKSLRDIACLFDIYCHPVALVVVANTCHECNYHFFFVMGIIKVLSLAGLFMIQYCGL